MALLFEYDFTGIGGADGSTVTGATDSSGNSRTLTKRGTGNITVQTSSTGARYLSLTGGAQGFDFAAGVGVSDAFDTALAAGHTLYFAVDTVTGAATFATLFQKSTTGNEWWPGFVPVAKFGVPCMFVGASKAYGGALQYNRKTVYAVSRTAAGVHNFYLDGRLVGTGTNASWSASSAPILFCSSSSANGFRGAAYYASCHDSAQDADAILQESQRIRARCGFYELSIPEDDVEVVVFSDSIIHLDYTVACQFALALQGALATMYGRSVGVTNYGQAGATWTSVNTMITSNSLAQKTFIAGRRYIVIVYEDVNTVAGGATAAATQAGFVTAINAIRTAATAAGATTFILGFTPFHGAIASDATMDAVAALRRANGTGSGSGVPDALLDLNADSRFNYAVTPSTFNVDQLHLSPVGTNLMAETIAPIVNGLAPKTTVGSLSDFTTAMKAILMPDDATLAPLDTTFLEAEVYSPTEGYVKVTPALQNPALESAAQSYYVKAGGVVPVRAVKIWSNGTGPKGLILHR